MNTIKNIKNKHFCLKVLRVLQLCSSYSPAIRLPPAKSKNIIDHNANKIVKSKGKNVLQPKCYICVRSLEWNNCILKTGSSNQLWCYNLSNSLISELYNVNRVELMRLKNLPASEESFVLK